MALNAGFLTVELSDLRELIESTYDDAVLYVKLYDDAGDEIDQPSLTVWTLPYVADSLIIVRKSELLDYVKDDRDDATLQAYLDEFAGDLEEAVGHALAER